MFFFDTCNAVAAREDRKSRCCDILNMACDCWFPCSCVYISFLKARKIVNILVFDLRVQLQHRTYQRKTLLFALIKVSTFICKREISGFSSPLKIIMWSYFYPFSLIKVHAIFRQLLSLLDELWFSFVLLQTTLDFVQWAKFLQNRIVAHFHQNL